jgi:hypothetical protein
VKKYFPYSCGISSPFNLRNVRKLLDLASEQFADLYDGSAHVFGMLSKKIVD